MTIDAVTSVLPNKLAVEGHTDNVPISGRYPSNWELSIERHGISPARLSAL